jgi:hypothetical protein
MQNSGFFRDQGSDAQVYQPTTQDLLSSSPTDKTSKTNKPGKAQHVLTNRQ